MRRLVPLLLLAGCQATGAVSPAAGALLNVGMASAVGGARLAEGDCFTICPTGTICNLKTKVCDPLPCHGRCSADELCDDSGPLDRCVPNPTLAQGKAGANGPPLSVSHEEHPDVGALPPLDVRPPMSSAPPTSPEHPDVPGR